MSLGLVGAVGRQCRAWNQLLATIVIFHPIILIPLVLVYLPGTIGVALLCGTLGKNLAALTALILSSGPYTAYDIAKTLFVVLAPLVWVHYLWLASRCFRAAMSLRMTVYAVLQLVVVTVFIFTAAHYYTALFSTEAEAYKGISNPQPEGGWGDATNFDDRLFFLPNLDTAIDFFYFSTVTTATVGYGDIFPVTRMAKLVTVAHIGFSFVLIVVILGWVIGHAKSVGEQGVTKQE